MLQVPIDKILPVTEARANISKLVDDVVRGDIYVLTRGGRPAVVVSSVEYIKKLTDGNISLNNDTTTSQPISASTVSDTPVANSNDENLPMEKPETSVEPAVYDEKPTEPVVYNEPITDVVQSPENTAENNTDNQTLETPALEPENTYQTEPVASDNSPAVDEYEKEEAVPVNVGR